MSDWEENDRLYETNKKQYLNQPDLELKQSHFAAKILELVDVKVLVENQKKKQRSKNKHPKGFDFIAETRKGRY